MPKTDTEIGAWLEKLREEGLDGGIEEIEFANVLAADFIQACRGAYRMAPKSCADAMDIVTQVLAKHDMLPHDPDESGVRSG